MTAPRLALAVAVLAASACSNTKVARQWADSSLREGAFGKTLVIVQGTATFNRRQTAEDHLVDALAKDGATAVRSWDQLPDAAAPDRAQLAQVVEGLGTDAILVVRVVSVIGDQKVSAGREQWVPTATGIDYYGYVSTEVGLYRRPDISEVRTAFVETTLWSVATRKLVWSAESDTTTASQTITTGEITDDFAKAMVKRVAPYLKRR